MEENEERCSAYILTYLLCYLLFMLQLLYFINSIVLENNKAMFVLKNVTWYWLKCTNLTLDNTI